MAAMFSTTDEVKRQVLAELKTKGGRPLSQHAVSSLNAGSRPRMIFSRRSLTGAPQPKQQFVLSESDLSKVKLRPTLRSIESSMSSGLDYSLFNGKSSTSGSGSIEREINGDHSQTPLQTSNGPTATPQDKAEDIVTLDNAYRASPLIPRASSSTSSLSLPLIAAPKAFTQRQTSTTSSSTTGSRPSSQSFPQSPSPPPLEPTSNVAKDTDSPSPPLPSPPPPFTTDFKSIAQEDSTTVTQAELQVTAPHYVHSPPQPVEQPDIERLEPWTSTSLLNPPDTERVRSATPNEVMRFFDHALIGQSVSMTSLDDTLNDSFASPMTPVFDEEKKVDQPNIEQIKQPPSSTEAKDQTIETIVPPLHSLSNPEDSDMNNERSLKNESSESEMSPRIVLIDSQQPKTGKKERNRRKANPNVTKFRPDMKTVRQQIKPGTVDELATLFTHLHDTEDSLVPARNESENASLSPRSDLGGELKSITLEERSAESPGDASWVRSDSLRSSTSSRSSKSSDGSRKQESSQTSKDRSTKNVPISSPQNDRTVHDTSIERVKQSETFDYMSASKDILKKVISSRESSRSNSLRREKTSTPKLVAHGPGEDNPSIVNTAQSDGLPPLEHRPEVTVVKMKENQADTSSSSESSKAQSDNEEEEAAKDARNATSVVSRMRLEGALSDIAHNRTVLTESKGLHAVPAQAERESGAEEIVPTLDDNKKGDEFIYRGLVLEKSEEKIIKTAQTGLEYTTTEQRADSVTFKEEEKRVPATGSVNGTDIADRPTSLATDSLTLASWVRTDNVTSDRGNNDVTVIDGAEDSISPGLLKKPKFSECRRKNSVTLSPVVDKTYQSVVSELKFKTKRKDSTSSSSSDEETGSYTVNGPSEAEWNATVAEDLTTGGTREDRSGSNRGLESDGANVTTQRPSHLQEQIDRGSGTGLFAHAFGNMERPIQRGESGRTFAEAQTATFSSYSSTKLEGRPGGTVEYTNSDSDKPSNGNKDDFMSILNDITLETDITSNFKGKANRLSGGAYSMNTPPPSEKTNETFGGVKDDTSESGDKVQTDYLSNEAIFDNPHHSVSEVSAGESDKEHFHLGLNLREATKSVKTHYTVTSASEGEGEHKNQENVTVTTVSLDEEIKDLHKALSPQNSESGERLATPGTSVPSTPTHERTRVRQQRPEVETTFDRDFFDNRPQSAKSLEKGDFQSVQSISNETHPPLLNPVTVKNTPPLFDENEVVLRKRRSSSSDNSSKRSSQSSNRDSRQELDKIQWNKDKFNALRNSFEIKEPQLGVYRTASADRKRFSGELKTGSRLSSNSSSLSNIYLATTGLAISEKEKSKESDKSLIYLPSTSGVVTTRQVSAESRHDVGTSSSDSDSGSGGEKVSTKGKSSKKRTKKYTYDFASREGKRDPESRRSSEKSGSSKSSKRKGNYDLKLLHRKSSDTSSSDSDDSLTNEKRTFSKPSSQSSSQKDIAVGGGKEDDTKMKTVVGEVSSFSIHRKVTSVEESSGASTENRPQTSQRVSLPDSTANGVYLIQDTRGDYYALQEVDSAPLSNQVQQVVSNQQIDYTFNQAPPIPENRDVIVDSSAVTEDKAREVISTFLDSQQSSQTSVQYQSENVYTQSAASRDTPHTSSSRVADGQYSVSMRAVDLQPHSIVRSSWSPPISSPTYTYPQSAPVQQEHVNVPGNDFSGNYIVTGQGNTFGTATNDFLRNSTVSVQTHVNTRSDNSQTWETSGYEPYTVGGGSEDSYSRSMLVTNVNTPNQQVYVQESHSSPSTLDNSFDQYSGQQYVVRSSSTALQPLSLNVNQDQAVQANYVEPFQTQPISVTTTTHAVVGEKVDMHIDFPPKEVTQSVTATAELVNSSSDEENKTQYRVHSVPIKSSLKKTSKYDNDTSQTETASDVVFTKKETLTADVTLGGKKREIKLYPVDDTGNKRSRRSSSESSEDESTWRVQRGGKLYPSSSVSPNRTGTTNYYSQDIYASQDVLDEPDFGSLWRVGSYSPNGIDSTSTNSRGRTRTKSPTTHSTHVTKKYRVATSKAKHHSPERFFKNAKLSLRSDDYEPKQDSSDEDLRRKRYKTVTRVYMNGESPPQQRSRSASPQTQYKVSSVQRQESYNKGTTKNDGRIYEIVNVTSTNKNDVDDEDLSGKGRKYRVVSDSESSIDKRKVRAHSSPNQSRKSYQDATITRTERVVPSRVHSLPPNTKTHRTVIQLEVDGDKNIKEKGETESVPLDSQYKVSSVMSEQTSLTNGTSFDSSPNSKPWRTRRSKSVDRVSRRRSSSDEDSNSDFESTGVYGVSPRLVKTSKQRDGSKMYVVNSTVTDPKDEGASVLYPPGWFQTTIDINDNNPDMKNKNYVAYEKNYEKPSQTFAMGSPSGQSYKTEKTVYFVRDASPPAHLPNKLSYGTHSSEFISPDSGQGTEIASSDGEGEAIKQRYERVERIYEVRTEPELPEQFREETDVDVSKDLRVLRGKILIKNRMDSEHDDDDFDENVNVFDNSFHLGKDNPLYSSDPDLLASLQREEEELARQINHDIDFETVDRIAQKYKGHRPQDLSPKPARRQNLSALLLSKLANVDSKDIRQSIDVEHHNEEIFGDIDFIHADGERRDSKNTSNFDSVNEKVELTLQQGKAYVIIKVIAERIVPTDYEFNVWRKSQAIVTRQIEIDLLANEQRRRLYNHVMDTVGPAGAIEAGSSRGHYDPEYLAPHEKQLSGMETLKLFSHILDVTDGGGPDKDSTRMRTKQEVGRLPSTSGMDLLY